jgi:hypothetical protein
MTTSMPTGTPTRTPSTPERKVAENRLRRIAARQGLRLVKSRRRDPRALAHGTYQLVDTRTRALVAGIPAFEGYGLDLVDVADRLGADADVRAAAVLAENAAVVSDRCARCGTPEPDIQTPEYLWWETLKDCSPVCPDCITPAEQQAADAAMMDTAEQARRARRGEK